MTWSIHAHACTHTLSLSLSIYLSISLPLSPPPPSPPHTHTCSHTHSYSHTHTHTDLLVGCESLLDDFDPLRKQSTSEAPPTKPPEPQPPSEPIEVPTTQDGGDRLLPPKIVELSITVPSPDSSPTLQPRRSSNPFRVSDDLSNINPFTDSFTSGPFPSNATTDSLTQANGRPPLDIRHCTSETNLAKLKKEYQPLRTLGEVEPLVTRSEEDLLSSTAESRHCMVDVDSHRHLNGGLGSPQRNGGSQERVNDPLDYKSRRSRSSENSPTQYRKSMPNQTSVDCKY